MGEKFVTKQHDFDQPAQSHNDNEGSGTGYLGLGGATRIRALIPKLVPTRRGVGRQSAGLCL